MSMTTTAASAYFMMLFEFAKVRPRLRCADSQNYSIFRDERSRKTTGFRTSSSLSR
jgi:hypothetical protein